MPHLSKVAILSRFARCFSSPAGQYKSRLLERVSKNKSQRLRLAAAYRGLDLYGLNEGICNHLSAIAPAVDSEEDVMLIIPHGLHWKEVTPSNLVGVNFKNEVVEGKGEPEVSARCIHLSFYEERPDIQSIMHTHMPYATALACLQDLRLLMLHQNSARFYDNISYDTGYHGLGDNFEEGKRLVKALGKKNVLFMGNHGVLVGRQTIATAFDDVYYLERAAKVQILAKSAGQAIREIDVEVVRLTQQQHEKVCASYAEMHLDAMIRTLRLKSPEFLS